MKKNIGLILSSLMLVSALAFTGCSSAKTTETPEANNEASEFVGTDVETSEVYDLFTEGLESVETADSITVLTDTTLSMGSDAGNVTSSESVNFKRVTEGENTVAFVDMKNSYLDPATDDGEQTSQISATFNEGYLYFESDGEKLKEAMTYEDLFGIVNRYTLGVDQSSMAKALVSEDGDNKTYYVEFDNENMGKMMEANLNSFGSAFSEDENMTINKATLTAEFDKDSNLVDYKFTLDAVYTTGETETETSTGDTAEATAETSPFSYSVSATFSDLDKTVVDAVEDMDSYTDVAELQAEMEAEQATAVE